MGLTGPVPVPRRVGSAVSVPSGTGLGTTNGALVTTAYDFTATDIDGNPVDLERYRGHPLLIVNTASKCGFTPQYEGLEKIHREYADRGLVVLGFPSDQFRQEEATDESIAKFCSTNYGVSFPMYSKTKVDGTDANPFYKQLKQATGKAPAWNFNKYLIGRDGKVIGHYPSDVTPSNPALLETIKTELAKPAPAGARTAQR